MSLPTGHNPSLNDVGWRVSLSTFLELREVKDRCREEFPKPPGPGQMPMAAPPLTESHGQAKKGKRVDWATLDRVLLWARGKKKI